MTTVHHIDEYEADLKPPREIEAGDDYDLHDLLHPMPEGCEEVRLVDESAGWSVTLWRAKHTKTA